MIKLSSKTTIMLLKDCIMPTTLLKDWVMPTTQQEINICLERICELTKLKEDDDDDEFYDHIISEERECIRLFETRV